MGRALDEAMTRYAQGEDDAFAAVYDQAAPALYGFLLKLCREPSRAEDLTHDVFLKMHQARGLFRPGAEVMPWAYTIARHVFLDSARGKRHETVSLDAQREERGSDPGIPATDAPADELIEASRLAERVERVLRRLPESQATAFRLLKQEGLSVAEAAASLGTTESAVKLRAHRAYEALRAELGETFEPAARTPTRTP